MKSVLRLLILEDDPHDAELIVAELEQGFYKCEWTRVETKEEFLACLETPNYDVVLSDFFLPNFDGLTALSLFKEKAIDVPFILVSGTIGENAAIRSMRSGATDYVLKDRISRLNPVMKRALKEVQENRKNKQIEIELKRLSAAINQMAEGIVITDTTGSILYTNPAFEQITGYTSAEVIGKNPRILASGKHDDAFYNKMWGTLLNGKTWKGRFTNRKKDGSLFTEDSTISPVKDEKGNIVNFVASKVDVTENLILEEQYRQALKMETIGRLAGGVAHDFNNILQTISGFSELIMDEIDPKSEIEQDVREIQQAVVHGRALTKQLLTFSRKDSVERKNVDLNKTLFDAKEMLNQSLKQKINKDIQLDFQLDPELPTVSADATQIIQVAINLTINARDAIEKKGIITIRTRISEIKENDLVLHPTLKPGNWICFSISDSGCGITETHIPFLFEPFYSTKEKGKGTGLGLSVAYGIVKDLGGWIRVESQPGVGSKFEVCLPM